MEYNNLITELNEERLDELLAYTPSFTAENVENIKKRCLQKKAIKRRTGRRTLLVAAIAVAIISLSGVALAVSTGFDFGSFYNSLFNNPDVEEKIDVSQTAVSNGLEITLVSAVVDRYQAYLTIEIRDLEGDRLSDSMLVVIEDAAGEVIHYIFTGPIIYNEAENKATIPLTVLYGVNIAELGEAYIFIDAIKLLKIRTGNDLLDFDLAGHAVDRVSTSLEVWHETNEKLGEAYVSGGWMGGLGFDGDIDTAIWGEGPERPVRPLEHGTMNLLIDGVDGVCISNIGIADGFLHVQFRSVAESAQERNKSYNFFNEQLCVIDGTGNVIDWYYCVTGYDHELMFDIGDRADFTDWRLALKSWATEIDEVIHGSWRIPFTVEKAMEHRTLIVYLNDDPVFSKLEVECSPVKFDIRMTGQGVFINERGESTRLVEGYDRDSGGRTSGIEIQREYANEIVEYYQSFELPYLTLEDGSIITLEPGNNMFDWLGGTVWCQTDYYDIETIRSITFCGVEYFFNGTA